MKPTDRALALFLRRLLLRSTLGPAERDAVLALPATAMPVKARTDIIYPGQTVDHACLVAEGLLGRYDQMADGSRQTTSLYIPGDMCDLMSVVLPTAGWGIAAFAPTTLVQVPHEALRKLVIRFPDLALSFWRDTAVDAATLAKWVSNIGRRDARARVAHLFCEMGRRMEQAGLGTRTSYAFPATQEQLGETLGLTGIHINRVLRGLREDGLVRFKSGLVAIDSLPGLEHLAEFDTRFLMLSEPSPTRQPSDAAEVTEDAE